MSRSTITRHQEDKLRKATSSLFPIKMIANLTNKEVSCFKSLKCCIYHAYKVKMPTIVGISTFMTRIKYVLSCVEHGKNFTTSLPVFGVSHKARLKIKKEISPVASFDDKLSEKRITKGHNQTVWMLGLVCPYVVHKPRSQVFSRRGPCDLLYTFCTLKFSQCFLKKSDDFLFRIVTNK